ncbi:MAG: hypothetical protein ACI86M_003308 [Saprospiraceae bacterium]|jgi:hypothetical protein
MNKSNILFLALFSIFTSAMMTSCSEEDIDSENLEPYEVVIITEVENPDSICNDLRFEHDWNLGNDLALGSEGGKAYLFKLRGDSDCETGNSVCPLNFQVVASEHVNVGPDYPLILKFSDACVGVIKRCFCIKTPYHKKDPNTDL